MKPNRIAAIAAVIVSAGVFATGAIAEQPTAEIVATFKVRPGNPSITPDGRILMSIHPLTNPTVNIVEMLPGGALKTYPNDAFSAGKNAKVKALIGIRTDDKGVAWILDLAARRLIGWDTRAEKQVAEFAIPADVLRPHSFLQDFALDQKRGRAIIADMTQGDLKSAPYPAFVTVDLKTGAAQRIAESHPSMMPEAEGGFALNPITIDPDYEWIYFGALNGRAVYRVPAASFDGDGSTVAAKIERYGPKPFSDGITVDSGGNVYITDIEKHAIGVTTSKGYRVIAGLPEGQSWPDGFSIGPKGYVYATVNQLDRTAALNSGKEEGSGTYMLVRIKSIAPSRTGR